MGGLGNVTHGDAARGRLAPEYRSWKGAKERCHKPTHPRYADYGGRGILMCAEWRDSYAAFLAYVGRKPSTGHSLDRIDCNRGYEPGNVRWATILEQARNRRRRIRLNGTELLEDAGARLGIRQHTLKMRRRYGWNDAEVASTPLRTDMTLTFRGRTLTVNEWATTTGLRARALRKRIRMGWPVHRILTEPLRIAR